jgi:hypothetical protein
MRKDYSAWNGLLISNVVVIGHVEEYCLECRCTFPQIGVRFPNQGPNCHYRYH